MNYGRLSKIFSFGDYERDQWVKKEANLISSGSRVLDVGAGTCKYRPLFKHCIYKTHDFAKLSKDTNGEGYGEIDYVSDICSIPVEDSCFDVVLCTEVLEHVPEPIRAIKEISRILKPGGTLLLTIPQRSGLHQTPYHFYGGYTPFWYKHFFPLNNLEIVSIEPNGGFFKNFGEESQRFVSILFPRVGDRRTWRVALFPVFLILKLFALSTCLACFFLDRFDKDKEFTVGYHIKAIKQKQFHA